MGLGVGRGRGVHGGRGAGVWEGMSVYPAGAGETRGRPLCWHACAASSWLSGTPFGHAAAA